MAGRYGLRDCRVVERERRVFGSAGHVEARLVHGGFGVFLTHGLSKHHLESDDNRFVVRGVSAVIAVLMAVGGSGGSTTGGIKFRRIGIIMKSVVAAIKEALAPDSARVVVSYNHVGRRVLAPDVVKEAMMVFILYVVTYAIGALVGIAHGYEATQAIFESVAMAKQRRFVVGPHLAGVCPPRWSSSIFCRCGRAALSLVTLLALVVEIVVSLNPRRLVQRS